MGAREHIFFDHRDAENRIRVLQEMLRTVSRVSGDPSLSTRVDGRFDPGTENAWRSFQRKYGLPETGVVDIAGWEKLQEVYEDALARRRPGDPIYPFFDPVRRICAGEESSLVMLLQILLEELQTFYDGYGDLSVNGRYDPATVEAVRQFQRANLLDATGEVDLATWNRLAAQYNYALGERQ